MVPSVASVLNDNGRAIFSGLVIKESEPFLKLLKENGLSVIEELSCTDWWGVAVEKKY
jgi:ribosomal protein L11 methyltransferase